MSRYFPRGPRSLCYRALELALVVAAPLLAVGLCSSPAAFASSPMIGMTQESSSVTGVTHSASTAATAPSVLTLSVAARPHDPTDLTLVSHLQSSSDNGGKSVAFFVVSTQFKQPEDVPIGTAKTAADGTASVSYKPTWSGKEQFVAKLTSPGAQVPAATAYYRVTASTPGPLYAAANPARPLSFIGHIFLGVVLTIVALIWLGLIIMLVAAVGWMPRLAGGGIGRRDK